MNYAQSANTFVQIYEGIENIMEDQYNNCFACGTSNPIGLKLKFDRKGDEMFSKFCLDSRYEGYPEVIHGGIISTIMDEAMAKVLLDEDITAFTVNINVDFLRQVNVGKEYTVISRIKKRSSRLFFCSGEIIDAENNVCAKAESKFLKPRK